VNRVFATYKTLGKDGLPDQIAPTSMTRVGRAEDLSNEDEFYFDEQTGVITAGPCDKPRQVSFTVELPNNEKNS
jgi:hypothetical protein